MYFNSGSAYHDADRRCFFFLIFFVEGRDVTVGAELQAFCPRRSPAHLFTENVKRHARVCFDDQFVVDMHDDGAAAQRFHGIAEYVAGGRLHDMTDLKQYLSEI